MHVGLGRLDLRVRKPRREACEAARSCSATQRLGAALDQIPQSREPRTIVLVPFACGLCERHARRDRGTNDWHETYARYYCIFDRLTAKFRTGVSPRREESPGDLRANSLLEATDIAPLYFLRLRLGIKITEPMPRLAAARVGTKLRNRFPWEAREIRNEQREGWGAEQAAGARPPV